MSSIRQTSFAAGELSPLLWGRTDLGLYRQGLRRMRDFFPSRHAMAVSRPGTQYLGGAYANLPSRLVPFRVSDADGFVLEFSSGGSMQVWQAGAKVGSAQVLPWSFTPVGDLQFTQSGDVLTICAKYDVYELRRTGSSTFTFSVFSFARKAPEWVQLPSGVKTTVPYLDVTTLTGSTTLTPLRPWKWWVSVLLRDSEGRVWETEGYEVTQTVTVANVVASYGGQAAVGLDRPVKISRRLAGTLWAGMRTFEVLGYNYYRGVGDYSGFVGSSKNELDFVDVGAEPDYSTPAPRAVSPFRWTMPSGGVTDYPRTVGYFEDRLVFGGTFYRPTAVLLSETGNYIGWQKPPVVLDDMALEFELAVRTRETIRGLLTQQRLLIFTDTSVWSLGGQGGLTPTNVQARVVSQVGSSPLFPMMVGTDALYSRAKGRGLQLVRPSDNAEGLFSSGDVSWHAEHLFRDSNTFTGVVDWWRATGKTLYTEIVDWAYQEDPWNLVWLVRADGKIITLQWDGETAGYALHATGTTWSDRFESVCTVPEGEEDAVYLCVKRGSNYLIERFTSRQRPTQYAGLNSLDCAVPFEEGPPVALIDLGAAGAVLEGRQVWAIADGNAPVGPLTVVAGKVDLAAAGLAMRTANGPGDAVFGWVGLLFEPELETLDVAAGEARNKQKTVTKVAVEVSDSKGLKAGQYPDKLTQWKQRRPGDGYGVPSAASEVVEILVQGGWDLGGRVTLKQSLPLPVTVLGITREVDGGG